MSSSVLPLLSKHGLAAPGSATNFGAFTPRRSRGCRAYVHVVLATASVFSYTVTDGTTAYTVALNGGVALTAGVAYDFGFACPGETDAGVALSYAFQVATDGVIRRLVVDEIYVEAA